MIAPFRPNADESSSGPMEPRLISELLPEVLARHGIDLSRERRPNRRRLATNEPRRQMQARPVNTSQRAAG